MLATSFRVAMHNTIAMASYDRPDLTNPPGNEWLIVERSGADGEVLTISDAGTAPGTPPATAPDGLAENNSMFGVLLHENEIGNDACLRRRRPGRGLGRCGRRRRRCRRGRGAGAGHGGDSDDGPRAARGSQHPRNIPPGCEGHKRPRGGDEPSASACFWPRFVIASIRPG